jgi:hypothetical protein
MSFLTSWIRKKTRNLLSYLARYCTVVSCIVDSSKIILAAGEWKESRLGWCIRLIGSAKLREYSVMSRLRLLLFSGVVLGFGGLLGLSGCGGSSSSVTVPPPTPSYTLTATALNPASVVAGGAATSTVKVTPANGYSGTITFSCSSVTGGTPAPTCKFSPSSVTISGTSAVPSTLTVSTTGSPAGSYSIGVTGSDANSLAPSNGAQALSLRLRRRRRLATRSVPRL